MGARVLTDLDVSSRQITKWLLDFQIGFPPTNVKESFITDTSSNAIISESAEYVVDDEFNDTETFDYDTVNTQEDIQLDQPVVNIKIDELKYYTGKVQPSFKDDLFIKKLAETLTNNQELFEKVNIKGHAGDFRANQKVGNTNKILSHSRANDILKRFATNGLPSSKILSMSFGEFNPSLIDRSNQKVELEFTGVKDEAQLREIINSIKQ